MEERRGQGPLQVVACSWLEPGRSAPGDSCQSDQTPEDLLFHRSVHGPGYAF